MRRNPGVRRWRLVLTALVLSVLVSGCGGCGVRDRGKNSDFDRPKAAEKK